MINQQEKRPLSVGSAATVHPQGENNPRISFSKCKDGTTFAQVVDTEERTWESPGVGVKALGRSATSHDNHAARQRAR